MNTDNKSGWLSSTRSFLSGVAKEVSSLVVPLPEQPASSASNITSPLGGNSYQSQQQQPQGAYGAYGQQQHVGYQQPQQPQQLQQQPYGAAPGQYGPSGYRSFGAPASPVGASRGVGYGGADSNGQASWSNADSDGVLPVVPLATQYAGTGAGSRRGSIDPSVVDPQAAFPTSHFPTSPVSALSQQLQPMQQAVYGSTPQVQQQQQALAQQQQQQQQQQQSLYGGGQQRYVVDELQSVTAVSGSPSPSPPPAHSTGGFHSSNFNPAFPQPPQHHLTPLLPNSHPQQQPLAPATYGGVGLSSMPPPSFQHTPATSMAPPAARRVLDENSMAPTAGPSSNWNGSQQQQQGGYGGGVPSPASAAHGYQSNTLVSPGRVLSPAFSTGDAAGGQTMGAGNILQRAPMPAAMHDYGQQGGVPQQQQMQQQSASSYGGGQSFPSSSSSGLPPPPPVSNYWKQRASAAPASNAAAPADPTVGRVDYSDLDYKSMDFAYNNRYERAQQQAQQQQVDAPYGQQQTQAQAPAPYGQQQQTYPAASAYPSYGPR